MEFMKQIFGEIFNSKYPAWKRVVALISLILVFVFLDYVTGLSNIWYQSRKIESMEKLSHLASDTSLSPAIREHLKKQLEALAFKQSFQEMLSSFFNHLFSRNSQKINVPATAIKKSPILKVVLNILSSSGLWLYMAFTAPFTRMLPLGKTRMAPFYSIAYFIIFFSIAICLCVTTFDIFLDAPFIVKLSINFLIQLVVTFLSPFILLLIIKALPGKPYSNSTTE